jgi:putative intracellular protease/amidase
VAKVVVPIPSRDFDPTEVAVPWAVLTGLGHSVVFTTPDGTPGRADDIMLTGRGLLLVGGALRANGEARAAYARMASDAAFRNPIRWDAVRANDIDALLLPGGHRARGMTEYLESPVVQQLAVDFFGAGKPVGAICHGVLVLARSLDPATGRSVLHGRKTTALTWRLESSAIGLGRIARFWDPNYYRTYADGPGQPAGYMSVQQEVTRALASPADFLEPAPDAPNYREMTSGLARDSEVDATPAFVVSDGPYVSARWPGDAHLFARTFAALLG